ncbi:DUF148 domain-containing protein [Caenorhabditis elegans]|uniref:DUF148 domain-containing protein n=1 Tax=Caenorhabditis elegans TaxID=6239 RepID=Q21151_CAEEL|nr:DUF148 domain-containing protein [Caenorhabditis elegans]CCD61876.1 DUF148 domain-containing protein [Caenorhabditis elegans]|eukprot:NP_497272.1 Uncharacterized protein CELE_K02F3.9 [Caenorhabditis elegans]
MTSSNKILLVFLLFFCIQDVASENGLDVSALSGKSKKFFFDMTKQVMGVPSLKPENLAAQAFFRSFLDKYTKLDDKVKNDMTQHVPKATKLFDAAAKKYNIDPSSAFKMLSTFFETFKKGASSEMASKGLQMAGKLLGGKGSGGGGGLLGFLGTRR